MIRSAEQWAPRPLVGREAEFEAVLNQLDSGGTALVALCGEAGIGKTRLLAEIADRSEGRDALVLVGRADFGLLLGALTLARLALSYDPPLRRSRA
jgi:MoxR-like ATPase